MTPCAVMRSAVVVGSLLVAFLAATPAAAEDLSAPVILMSPHRLAFAYQENEVRSDARYKDRVIELIGVATEIRRDPFNTILIEMDAGRGFSVRCYFEESEASEIARLNRGQLVAIAGRVKGRRAGGAILKPSRVLWMDQQAVTPTTALVLARSSQVCGVEILKAALREEITVSTDPVYKEQATQAIKTFGTPKDEAFAAKYRKDLVDKKLEPLPCTNPVVRTVFLCEDAAQPEKGRVLGWMNMGPECAAPLVKAALAKLAKN